MIFNKQIVASRGRRLGVALLAVAAFAGACSSADTEPVAAGGDSPATTAAAEPAAGNPTPTLTLISNTSDGGQLDWASLEGKDVMLWFWAPW